MEYNILLQADIETINTLCHVSKVFKNICQDYHFWKEKFTINQLPLILKQTIVDDWIKEYKTIDNINTKIVKLINVITLDKYHEAIYSITSIYIIKILPNYIQNDLNDILDKHGGYFLYTIKFYIDDNDYGVTFNAYYNDKEIFEYISELTYVELKKLFYWMPKVDLYDSRGISFLLSKLEIQQAWASARESLSVIHDRIKRYNYI
jgi:hypothetical protein